MALDVEGIILKSFNYGEKHKIIKIVTPKLGVIGVFISNGNKVGTKKNALVQPLTCAYFNLKDSSTGTNDLFFLNSGDIEDYFLDLKLDYEKVTYGYYMAEIILKGNYDPEHNATVYNLFKRCLVLANEGYSIFLLNLIFQLKMLPLLGIKPVIDYCAICQTTENIVTLSVSQGGLVCGKCINFNEPIILDAPLIPIVRALYKVDLNNFPEIELEEEYLKPIETFLENYYDAYSGLYLNSKKFIKDLK